MLGENIHHGKPNANVEICKKNNKNIKNTPREESFDSTVNRKTLPNASKPIDVVSPRNSRVSENGILQDESLVSSESRVNSEVYTNTFVANESTEDELEHDLNVDNKFGVDSDVHQINTNFKFYANLLIRLAFLTSLGQRIGNMIKIPLDAILTHTHEGIGKRVLTRLFILVLTIFNLLILILVTCYGSMFSDHMPAQCQLNVVDHDRCDTFKMTLNQNLKLYHQCTEELEKCNHDFINWEKRTLLQSEMIKSLDAAKYEELTDKILALEMSVSTLTLQRYAFILSTVSLVFIMLCKLNK